MSDGGPSRPQTVRVEWEPGSDRLHGRCHCGVELELDDPVTMWERLLDHPSHAAGDGRTGRAPVPA